MDECMAKAQAEVLSRVYDAQSHNASRLIFHDIFHARILFVCAFIGRDGWLGETRNSMKRKTITTPYQYEYHSSPHEKNEVIIILIEGRAQCQIILSFNSSVVARRYIWLRNYICLSAPSNTKTTSCFRMGTATQSHETDTNTVLHISMEGFSWTLTAGHNYLLVKIVRKRNLFCISRR